MEQTTARQVYELILNSIENGVYPYGQPIPSERVLADTYYVSRTTVRKAIDLLASQGLLYRVQGKGTFVSLPRLHASNAIVSTRKYLEENGIVPSTRVLFCGVRKAERKFGKIFQISEDAPVFQLFRLRLGDQVPYGVEYTYLPLERFPNAPSYDFSRTSLYQCFEDHQVPIAYMHQTLDLVTVQPPQSALLELPKGASAFLRKNYVHDPFGRVAEYTRSYSVAEKYVFEIF